VVLERNKWEAEVTTRNCKEKLQQFSNLLTPNVLIPFENIIKLCSTGMNLSCCRSTDCNIFKKLHLWENIYRHCIIFVFYAKDLYKKPKLVTFWLIL